MERELSYLLSDLCVIWGFCIPPIRNREICKASYWSAKEFATSIVEAEGMNPAFEQEWIHKIAEKFRDRFGKDEISTSTFVRSRSQAESHWLKWSNIE